MSSNFPEVVGPGLEVEDLLDGGKVLVRDVKQAVALDPLRLESLPRAEVVCKRFVSCGSYWSHGAFRLRGVLLNNL